MLLVANEQTQAIWSHAFELTLTLHLRRCQLRLSLDIHNPGDTPGHATGGGEWAFSGALHSYLAVDDLAQAQLYGLGGQAEWDSLRNLAGEGAEVLTVDGEGAFDRVYAAASEPLRLIDGAHQLTISQSPSWAETVVWNPGAAMPDLPGDSYRQMLCVEAAQVLSPVTLAAGERWSGWQQFDVAM